MLDTIILFIVCLVVTLGGFICSLYLRNFIIGIKRKREEKQKHKQVEKISRMKAKVVKEPKSRKRR